MMHTLRLFLESSTFYFLCAFARGDVMLYVIPPTHVTSQNNNMNIEMDGWMDRSLSRWMDGYREMDGWIDL